MTEREAITITELALGALDKALEDLAHVADEGHVSLWKAVAKLERAKALIERWLIIERLR